MIVDVKITPELKTFQKAKKARCDADSKIAPDGTGARWLAQNTGRKPGVGLL